MRPEDFFPYTASAILAHRMRSFLTALGIAVGIAAVILLTSIGEGVHQFVLAEFTQFGTHLIAIQPGKTSTQGSPSAGVISSVRALTLEDAEALKRAPYVEYVNPSLQGNADVEFGGKTRRTTIFGEGADMPLAFRMNVGAGRFLPPDESAQARAFTVLGSKLKEELFGSQNALGARIRIGSEKYRVVGVMEPKGQVLGFDLDDAAYIPAARALEMFNRPGLMEIQVTYRPDARLEAVEDGLKKILLARHGREDFTLIPQQKMLEVLGSVLDVLTFAVGALGGISLLVGAVGISTIMTLSVGERISEIGLLRALGAGRSQILWLFLGDAALLAAVGGVSGLLLGIGLAQLLHAIFPALPVHTPLSFVVLAEGVAIAIGLAAGVLPARRAALLDPVEALRTE